MDRTGDECGTLVPNRPRSKRPANPCPIHCPTRSSDPASIVSLTYSIADEAGNILEQTDLPVGYIHGGHTELIGGMDEAVSGKRAGDRVELQLCRRSRDSAPMTRT